jgi:hypothetical protein
MEQEPRTADRLTYQQSDEPDYLAAPLRSFDRTKKKEPPCSGRLLLRVVGPTSSLDGEPSAW